MSSPEAWFVRRYEFWTRDNGIDECIDVKDDSFKEVLLNLLEEQDYEVLSNSTFSKTELLDFIKNYDAENGDYDIEDIIEEYIECNINYDA